MYLYWAIAFLYVQKGYATHSNNEKFVIWNGHTIQIEDAPYIAALMCKEPTIITITGASIIHERFLLTTACVIWGCKPDGCTYIANVGSNSWEYNTTKIEIEKFICHKDYNPKVYASRNDICLVKLKEPVPFSKKVAKIDLPDKNFQIKVGTMLNVTGFGFTESEFPAEYLKQTTIPLVSQKLCKETNKEMDVKTQLCAGLKGHGFCLGDQGGPLTYNNILVGISSYENPGRKGDNNTFACGYGMDVYTNVTSFLDWINETITNNL